MFFQSRRIQTILPSPPAFFGNLENFMILDIILGENIEFRLPFLIIWGENVEFSLPFSVPA